MKHSILKVALVVSSALSAAGMALANTSDAEELKMFSEAQIDIQQALLIGMDGTDGKVSSIEFESEDGKAVYEVVAVAPDGSLSEIVIDANDGTIIERGPYVDDDD